MLVVDDSPFVRKMLISALGANGFEIAGEAGDGKAALDAYARLRPDFVTLDLVMPVLDGLATLRALRAADPKARVVIVSGAGDAPLVELAVREGAAAYLVKPFKDQHVADAMRAAGAVLAPRTKAGA